MLSSPLLKRRPPPWRVWHSILAIRWCLFPLLALAFSGSLLVACQLSGHFATWSAAVLAADASRARTRPAEAAVLLALALVLGGLVLACAPLVGLELLAAYTALLCLGAALGRCVRVGLGEALYATWTTSESLLGLGMSSGLVFAASTLLADTHRRIEPGWQFTWYALCINCGLSFLSTAVAVPLLCCRAAPGETRSILRSSEDQQVIGAGDDEVAEIARIAVEVHAQSCHGATVGSPRQRKALRWLCGITGALCCSCMVGCTAVFLLIHAFPPGHSVTTFQACEACFCKENVSADAVHLTRDVVYGQGAKPLLMDVYASEKSLRNGTSPAVVMIHGGNFMAGSKNEGVVVDESHFFASSGFVAFSINYQLESDNYLAENQAVRDAVHDAKAAVRFIRKHAKRFHVDPAQIAVWGESAGAIVAASMNSVSTEGDSGTPGVSSQVSAALGLAGTIWPFLVGMPGNDVQEVTPWFNVHGTRDSIVFPFLAVMTHTFLMSRGLYAAENRLVWVPGGEHVAWDEATRSALRPAMLRFLAQALELPEVCGGTETTSFDGW